MGPTNMGSSATINIETVAAWGREGLTAYPASKPPRLPHTNAMGENITMQITPSQRTAADTASEISTAAHGTKILCVTVTGAWRAFIATVLYPIAKGTPAMKAMDMTHITGVTHVPCPMLSSQWSPSRWGISLSR